MKKLHLIFLLLFLSLALTNCNREKNLKCSDANTVKVPPHAIDYFYFKVGTWWVYECEQTGETDSLWVSENDRYAGNPLRAKQDCSCGKGLCFQEAYTHIVNKKSVSSNLILLSYFMGHYLSDVANPIDDYGRSELREYRSDVHTSGYKIDYINQNYINKSTTGAALSSFDTLTVKGKTDNNIFEYKYDTGSSGSYPDWYLIAWYSKNISLIKYIKTDKTIWNLIKYNIVK